MNVTDEHRAHRRHRETRTGQLLDRAIAGVHQIDGPPDHQRIGRLRPVAVGYRAAMCAECDELIGGLCCRRLRSFQRGGDQQRQCDGDKSLHVRGSPRAIAAEYFTAWGSDADEMLWRSAQTVLRLTAAP
jgi:hypothetical protein